MRIPIPITAALCLPLLMTACGGGGGDSLTSTTPTPPIVQPASTEGRLLASNCFQCHATYGTGGFDRIAGDAGDVWEFRSKVASEDIMAAHALGYTDSQLQLIVDYLNQIQLPGGDD